MILDGMARPFGRRRRGDDRPVGQDHPRPHVLTIVSGGQTGVDRAALDVAIAHGFPYGGWCPAGGWAEDLPDPPGLLARYPGLRTTPQRDPGQRTEWNVRDSDGTLIVAGPPGRVTSPGTERTAAVARALGRPCAWVDVEDPRAGAYARAFLATLPAAAVVNVAGPRESELPGIGAAATALLTLALLPTASGRAAGGS